MPGSREHFIDGLRALRHERGCVYEDLGQQARARREFERIFAEDPDYADVRQRLLGPQSGRRGRA